MGYCFWAWQGNPVIYCSWHARNYKESGNGNSLQIDREIFSTLLLNWWDWFSVWSDGNPSVIKEIHSWLLEIDNYRWCNDY